MISQKTQKKFVPVIQLVYRHTHEIKQSPNPIPVTGQTMVNIALLIPIFDVSIMDLFVTL